ncbi:MAG TPA: decaprenyl-phosphate phosphoribosyltransferase [Candidatus Sulfomarinibacteraceae bacterium]|nr:decaprenyl-phosphate phosphoribosyltransferase [Candidatus Sulfomarinibacteraceae bacterium]
MTRKVLALVRSLRPEQWLKNGFVLAPMVFSGLLDVPAVWLRVSVAVLAFCAASSAVYLVNDVIDRRSDRRHPDKRHRPIAAGDVSVAVALAVAAALGVAAMAAAVALGGWFPTVLGSYIGLVVLYSLVLKRVVFVDVLVLAGGFVLRVVGGAVAIDVPVSRWLLLCAYLLALYLALGKRRAELALLGDDAGSHREVLGHYSLALVDQAISVVLGATVLAYTLYTVAPDTVAKVGSEGLMATVPIVLYGLFRYLYLLHRQDRGGSPTRVVATDRPLLIAVLFWLAVAAVVIRSS